MSTSVLLLLLLEAEPVVALPPEVLPLTLALPLLADCELLFETETLLLLLEL